MKEKKNLLVFNVYRIIIEIFFSIKLMFLEKKISHNL